MILHIIGYVVLAWTLATGAGVGWYLATHSVVPLSWEQRLPVPELAAMAPSAARWSGSDFVGYV